MTVNKKLTIYFIVQLLTLSIVTNGQFLLLALTLTDFYGYLILFLFILYHTIVLKYLNIFIDKIFHHKKSKDFVSLIFIPLIGSFVALLFNFIVNIFFRGFNYAINYSWEYYASFFMIALIVLLISQIIIFFFPFLKTLKYRIYTYFREWDK